MINALSIDLEFWYSPEFVSGHDRRIKKDQLIESVEPLLELLRNYSVSATFFVLGSLAKQYPELIRIIHKEGHEIASHGYSHTMLERLGKKGFDEEIMISTDLLSKITGTKPIGFRAPSFSVNQSTSWCFEILSKYGYKYDSSIFPIRTMLYGEPDAPTRPYRPDPSNITVHDENGDIVEFPLSTIRFVRNIPVSGGFYFRFFPLWFLKSAIKSINKKNIPAIIYLHPWELYRGSPRLVLSRMHRVITYYGIDGAMGKFEKMLKAFQFAPVREVLDI